MYSDEARLTLFIIAGTRRRSPSLHIVRRLSLRPPSGLAVELGLLQPDSGRTTQDGNEALDPKRYDAVMRRCVGGLLSRSGCPVEKLEAESVRMLHSRKVILPTADELYTATVLARGLPLPAGRFRTLLRLLCASGGMRVSRNHIFLPAKS